MAKKYQVAKPKPAVTYKGKSGAQSTKNRKPSSRGGIYVHVR